MSESFGARLAQALVARRAVRIPAMRLVAAAVVMFTMLYIAVAITIGTTPDALFIDERGPVTALSALFLCASGAFSLAMVILLAHSDDRDKWIWLLMAVGFAFLSLDELLQFHERIGAIIGRSASSGVFRNWNDLVVILYGVIALPILLLLLPRLARWPMVLELFAMAVVFYVLHTVIDSVSEPPTAISRVVEESSKLLCGAFLMLGTLAGFVGGVWCRPRRNPPAGTRE